MSDSEEDYMSAAILEEAEQLSKPNMRKRPRARPPPPPQPRKKRTPQEQAADERERRARGLKTSLLPPSQSETKGRERRSASHAGSAAGKETPQDQETPSSLPGAAWRQMLAMGFKPGGRLGARPAEGPAEPLPIDERRLKGGKHVRAGIGAAPVVEEAPVRAPLLREEEEARRAQEAEEALHRQGDGFRARQSALAGERHLLALLRGGRHAVLALDEKAGRDWTPLWEDGPAWVARKQQEAMRLPSLAPDTLAREGGREGAHEDEGDKARALEAEQKRGRDEEMEAFAARSLEEQLDRTLRYLRGTHFFCLFCREQYASAEELASSCPGLAEDEHDD